MAEPQLHAYVNQYLPQLHLARTAQDVLQEFIDIDVTSDDLVRILKNNPSYQHFFEKYVNKKSPPKAESAPAATENKEGAKKEEIVSTPTHRLIALLGMIGSRNFILALRLAKASTGFFPVTAEGSMDFKPTDHLRYCMEMEELALRNNIEYGETLFAAAHLYDWLNALAKKGNYKKLEPFIQQSWKHARNTAIVAHALGKRVKNLSFQKYAGAAGLLHNGGKILIALATAEGADGAASYLSELEKAEKQSWKFTSEQEILREKALYSVQYEELSAMILLQYRVFKDLERSIRYHNEPYFLKSVDKNSYQLACTINLASLMAKSWKTPADDKDPLLKEWSKPWTKDLKLQTKDLIEVMKWSMTLK